MSFKLNWHPQRFDKKLDKKLDKNVGDAAKGYAGFVKSLMGAGGYPGIKSGALKASITASKIAEKHWGVGTNKKYALALEFGTGKMGPKPFFRPSLSSFKNRIKSYFK